MTFSFDIKSDPSSIVYRPIETFQKNSASGYSPFKLLAVQVGSYLLVLSDSFDLIDLGHLSDAVVKRHAN